MNDNEILERIVVEVSRDKKEGSGTGFYISADKIATCYHVLVPEGKKPKRNGIYWIRNDSRDKKAWQKATLVKSRPLPDDIAVLKTEKRLDLFGPDDGLGRDPPAACRGPAASLKCGTVQLPPNIGTSRFHE